jgi:hypothetical protein
MNSDRFRPGILHGARGAGKGVLGRGVASPCAAAFSGTPTRIELPGAGVAPPVQAEAKAWPLRRSRAPGGRAGFPLPGFFKP